MPNIQRKHMPQVNSNDMNKAVRIVKKYASVSTKSVPVGKLKKSQKDIYKDKVQQIAKGVDDPMKMKPLVISNDYHIVDGHHRWLAIGYKFGKKAKVPVVMINKPSTEAIAIFKKVESELNEILNKNSFQSITEAFTDKKGKPIKMKPQIEKFIEYMIDNKLFSKTVSIKNTAKHKEFMRDAAPAIKAGLLKISHNGDTMEIKVGKRALDLQFESDQVKGGLADKMTLVKIAKHHDKKGYYDVKDMVSSLKKQLQKGIKVEMEHTDDPTVAKEIAMDHLYEDPNYYDKLAKIEEKLTKSDPIETWIRDFIKSDDKRFKGKSKKQRIDMAKGAYYAAQKNESLREDINIPVNIGDTILTGRFKNKKVKVKSIGKDDYGMPTINGKKVVTFRIMKEGVYVNFPNMGGGEGDEAEHVSDKPESDTGGKKIRENTLNELPMGDVLKIDNFADIKLAPSDIVLTGKHFFDRLNDPRNEKEISMAELVGFFKRLARKKAEFIEFLNKYQEVVATDKRTNINIPFMKRANKVIAKTIMRTPHFKTRDVKVHL